MTFRPMLWPTVAGVLALGVLIVLGNWQMDRLAWKQDLIARIETGLQAPPIALPPAQQWANVSLDDLRYRPVAITGRFDHANEVHVYIPSKEGDPGYHVVTPVELTGNGAEGGWVLVDRGFVPINRKEPETRSAGQLVGDVTVEGILILPDAPNAFTPPPDSQANVWYHRPIAQIAEHAGISPVFPLMLDAGPKANEGGWPLGGQTRLVLKNPHLGYAMTWYGLAATLIGIWLAFHIARGRIRLW